MLTMEIEANQQKLEQDGNGKSNKEKTGDSF
uniref:Uncharacterized protein n=1 Tax=Anguilla anguilla TaxID=7936 RepID=A0A0E9TQJ1_ANGAN